MVTKQNFKKISKYLWEIPKSFRSDMRVPARVYASEKILETASQDKSLEQLVNLATLPGVEKYALAMPDIHEGYGSPIGGVFACRISDGIISPGAVGYDINCGVRLLISSLKVNEIEKNLEKVATLIQQAVPSGLGRGHLKKLKIAELNQILEKGLKALVKQGFASQKDLENCEDGGSLDWADQAAVSEIAKRRGLSQLGTLGSGNHFLEIQKVAEIFDEAAASAFGIFKNQIAVMIHCGSRGLGHQVATDYIHLMLQVMPKYHIYLHDRELACAPFDSPEGQKYFSAMAAAANFGFANRQMISYLIREQWQKIFSGDELKLLYDVAHNIAKIESYIFDKSQTLNLKSQTSSNFQNSKSKINTQKLIVHRKGSTRSFPPGHPEIPEAYRQVGQPVILPGSMGTASYLMHGRETANESFYSVSHGSGRIMSRHQAIRTLRGAEIVKHLEKKGILVKCYSTRGIAEEAPQAYKNIEEVVKVIHQAGLARKVARLVPLAAIKGE